ncbi:hypothetical protein [Tateyamaria sp.]|uniref:hypothetical protein n=1 Tax=Tateyamaria sp. TaxID=1929288 RepID=UPI0032A0C9AD
MARKPKAELEAEGAEIADIIAAARRVDHNFALFLGKDDFIFKAHRLKKTSVMRRLAKAEGAGVKGAVGVLRVKGKQIELEVDDPEATPPNFAKRIRKFLSLRGHILKVRVVSATGELLEEGGDDDADEIAKKNITQHIDPSALVELDADLEKVSKKFKALTGALKKSLKSAPPVHREKLMVAVNYYQQAIALKSPKRAMQAVKVVKKLIACTPSGENTRGQLAKAGSDPVKLSKLKGLATTLSARAATDPAFLDRNYKGMQAMRSAMRNALTQKPSPEVAQLLREIKSGMDMAVASHPKAGED